jgi:predicted  nucleic acid-binding Zn-ribbon protein
MADMNQTRKEYQEKMAAQIRALGAEIDKLKARGSEASAEARQQYEQQIAALRSQQSATQERLQELQQSSNEAWDDLKGGFEKAWKDLQKAVDRARTRF